MNSTLLQGGRPGKGEKSNSFRQYLKMAKQMGLSKEELAQVRPCKIEPRYLSLRFYIVI